MKYEEKEFYNWEDIKNYISHFSNGWIFRGQGKSNWQLKTSWERAPFYNSKYPKLEKSFIDQFKRGVLSYLDSKYIPKNIVEWLALMQHYGAPTRFLDFSNSPYVATFFAVENNLKQDFALWIVNEKVFSYESRKIISNEDDYLKNEDFISNENLIEKFIELDNIKAIFGIETFNMNQRFKIQRGVFLCPGSINFTFQENLEILGEEQFANIKKVIIPNNLRLEILADLDLMNINRENLFLDLNGYSKTLTTFFETKLS